MHYANFVLLGLCSLALASPLEIRAAGDPSAAQVLEKLAKGKPLAWQIRKGGKLRVLNVPKAQWAQAAKAVGGGHHRRDVSEESAGNELVARKVPKNPPADPVPAPAVPAPPLAVPAPPIAPPPGVPAAAAVDPSLPPVDPSLAAVDPSLASVSAPANAVSSMHAKCYNSGSWAFDKTLVPLITSICDEGQLNWYLDAGSVGVMHFLGLTNEKNDEMSVYVLFKSLVDAAYSPMDANVCTTMLTSLIMQNCQGKNADTRGGVMTAKNLQGQDAVSLSIDPTTAKCNC